MSGTEGREPMDMDCVKCGSQGNRPTWAKNIHHRWASTDCPARNVAINCCAFEHLCYHCRCGYQWWASPLDKAEPIQEPEKETLKP